MKIRNSGFIFVIVAMLVTSNVLARPRGHTYFSFGVGPYWGWNPYYNYPYYAPVIIERAPQVIYIEKPVEQAVPAAKSYWYYCEAAQGYYPYVKQCPTGWMKVVPQTPDSVSP